MVSAASVEPTVSDGSFRSTSRHPSVRSGSSRGSLRALSRDTSYDAPSFIKRAAFNRTLHFNKHFTELDDAKSSLASLHMAASTGTTYILR